MTAIEGHPAFEHCRSREIATLNLTMHEFRHRRTGAPHYHLSANHDENVFMVAFRTVPMDSTGVAHILEHTTLCGSERYPVRDPFFLMMRRSLNTFMNAFTTNDYTAYPFASQNRKDFFNLLDIYLDSVFFPRLDRLDFAQEGHRVEFEDPMDPDSPLVYRGVVYNEMKGDTSSPVSVLFEHLQSALFPTTTYHYNSGGDPQHIPELTYEDLLAFYRSHYHPGNAVFMTFGNIPPKELQAAFEDKALSRFDRLDEKIEVPCEQRYETPVRTSAPYVPEDADDLSAQTHVVMGWLLGPSTDLDMLLACNLLADVLLDTSASPLRQALEATPLATAVSPLCGLEEGNHEVSFMCGVEGSEIEHADAIESLIIDTLERVADEGVPVDRLEAVLHQLELHQREVGGDGVPYGLQLIFASMAAAIHRGDPIELLDLDAAMARLRKNIKDPDYIKQLVRELLLDNCHRVRLVLYPDPDLEARQQAEEQARLEAVRAALDDEQRQQLIDRATALKERQEGDENIDLLPRVTLDDIAPDIRVPEGEVTELDNGVRLDRYEAGTNGLVYHQVVTPLPAIAPALAELLPLYTQLASEVGSAGRDYLDTQDLQHGATGGINVFTAVRADRDDVEAPIGYLTLSSRTLNRKCEDMVSLVRDTCIEPRFDEWTRIRDLVSQIRARRQAGVTNNGHIYAMSAAASHYRSVSWLNHRLTGLAGLRQLIALDDGLGDQKRLGELAGSLAALHESLAASSRRLLVISDPEFMSTAVATVSRQWTDEHVGAATASAFRIEAGGAPADQAWLVSTQVNFCAMAFPTVPERHPDSAPLTVLAGILRNGYLHRAIREQGGAYGGGAAHDTGAGIFRFFSYRDPNLMQTFDAFRKSIDWILAGNADKDRVEEAILAVIASIDAPASPAGEARQAFHNKLFGRDAAHRRGVRSAILAVEPADVRRVAAQYLQTDGARAVVTNQSRAKQLPGSFDINSIAE